MKRSTRELLEAHTQRAGADECWLWLGGTDRAGYGEMSLWQRRERAHRVAWALENGPIPPHGVIRHLCDNPPCVNPRHLRLGTQADNIADKVERSRQAVGVRVATAKLDDAAVRHIREQHAQGHSYRSLAREFGVSHRAIQFVVYGTTWRHVS